MGKTKSKVLVIDASIAQAVGSSERTKPLRDFLMGVYNICHQAVTTPEIRIEWKNHHSDVFQLWRKSMYSKKKIKDEEHVPEDSPLRQYIGLIKDQEQKKEMEKDLHLIEAALTADKIIISLDNKAEKHFGKFLKEQKIQWINPLKDKNAISSLE